MHERFATADQSDDEFADWTPEPSAVAGCEWVPAGSACGYFRRRRCL